jgi:23S rRNA pseudouridine2605 synthase
VAQIRLQTFLARCGVASRRAAERLILDRRIRVNGKVVDQLGSKVDPRADRVSFDGASLVLQDHVWLLLHKPPGTVCTASDPEGRQTVLDLVRIPGARVYPVGRLDYHTSGVLVLTNDGELAQRLMHPSRRIPRVYHVKVAGLLDNADLDRLREGITLDDGKTVRADASLLAKTSKHTWVEMTLRQGLNRQIHRMLEALGRRVLKLIRVEFAGIRADDLPPARFRELTQGEVDTLRQACNLSRQTARSKATTRSRRTARNEPSAPRKPTQKPSAPRKPAQKPSAPRKPTQKPSAPRKPTQKPSAPRKPTQKPSALRKSTQKPSAPRKPTQKTSAPRSKSRRPSSQATRRSRPTKR